MKAQPQGFGSQCIIPLFSSALRVAKDISSKAIFFFFFNNLVSPTAVSGFLTFHSKNLPKRPKIWTQKGYKRELKAEISDLFRLWPHTETLLQQPWAFYMVPTSSQLTSRLPLLSLAMICFNTVSTFADSSPYQYLPSWTYIWTRPKQKFFLHFPQVFNKPHAQTLNHIDVFSIPVCTHNDIHHIVICLKLSS